MYVKSTYGNKYLRPKCSPSGELPHLSRWGYSASQFCENHHSYQTVGFVALPYYLSRKNCSRFWLYTFLSSWDKSLAWCSKCKFSLLHKFTFVPAFCTVPVAHFQCYALSCSLLSDSVSCRTSIAMEVNDSCGKKKISKLLKIWWCLSGISFWGGTNGWELLLWIKQLSVHLECTLKRSDCFSYKYPTHMTLSALHCVKFWNQNDFWPPHLKSHQFCLGDLSTVFYGEKINQCLRHNFGGNYVMNEQMFT